jgi:hypothetical protein
MTETDVVVVLMVLRGVVVVLMVAEVIFCVRTVVLGGGRMTEYPEDRWWSGRSDGGGVGAGGKSRMRGHRQ